MMIRHAIKKAALVFFLSFLVIKTQAQVGIGTTNPDPSAALHVYDTIRGLLIPRLTDVQRNAISSPAEGLLVYQTNNAVGFWYFTGGNWKNMALANNGGKQTLVLSDNITNSEAAAKIAAEVGPNTQEVRIQRCNNLTSVDLSMISSLTEVYISGNPVLQTVNFSNLQGIDGGIFIDKCPLLANLTTTSLKAIGQTFGGTYGLHILNSGVSSLSFPLLTRITGTIYIYNNSALSSISFPQMTDHPATGTVGFNVSLNTALTSFSAPSLTSTVDLSIFNNYNLASLDFSALATVRSLSIAATSLSSISFPALTTTVNCFLLFSNNALTTLSLPVLTTTGCMNFGGNHAIVAMAFPSLTSMTEPTVGTYINNNTNLASINFNNLTNFANANFNCEGNKLPSSQVNYLLNKFVTITPAIVNKEFDLRQSIAAPPTGQGIIDKATLIARPNSVATD